MSKVNNRSNRENIIDTIAGTLIFFGMWFGIWLVLYIFTGRLEFQNNGLIMTVFSFFISFVVIGYYRYQDFKNIKVSQSYIEYVASTKKKDFLGRTVMNYGEMNDLPLSDLHVFDVNGDNFIGQFIMRRRNNYGATTQIRNKYFKPLVSLMLPVIQMEEDVCHEYWQILHEYSGAEEGFNQLDGIAKNFLVGYYPLFNRDVIVEKNSPKKQLEMMDNHLKGEAFIEQSMDDFNLEYFKDISIVSPKTGESSEIDYLLLTEDKAITIKVVSDSYASFVVDSTGQLYDDGKKNTVERKSIIHPINRENEIIRDIFGKFMRTTNIIVFTGDTIKLVNNYDSPTVRIIQAYKLENILKDIVQYETEPLLAKLLGCIVEDKLYNRYDLLTDYNKMIEDAQCVIERLNGTLGIIGDHDDFLLKRKVAYKEWVKGQNFLFFSHNKYVRKFEKHVDNMFSLKYVFGVDNISAYKTDLMRAKRLMEEYLTKLNNVKDDIQKIFDKE